MSDLKTILNEITNNLENKDAAVFFGAGLSFNSGLPIVVKLLNYLFEKMEMTADQRKLIMDSNLPFEAIMETVLEESSLDDILDIFEEGIPNSNHAFLAKLVKNGYVNLICTTNFDTLLEQALEKENLTNGKDFFVYSSSSEIRNIDWSIKSPKLIKIHGCITQKAEMAITMKQVAGMEFSNPRENVITEIFSGNHCKSVLVLGYSCSDLFDISPQIEQLSVNLNEVIFIEHCSSGIFRKESITVKEDKNPFKKFIQGTRILINTDDFIKVVWESMYIGSYVFESYPETSWRKKIDYWYAKAELESGASIKNHIAARLLYDIGEFEESVVQNKRAAEVAQQAGNILGFSSAMANMAKGYTRLGDYDKAEFLFNKSISAIRTIECKKAEASQLESLGILLHTMGRNEEALKKHKEALAINEAIKDDKSISTTLGNMGNVYNRLGLFDKAIEVALQGLSISQRHGIKQTEGSQLGIIGMAYFNIGKVSEAKEYMSKSIATLKLIGDTQGEAMMKKVYAIAIALHP